MKNELSTVYHKACKVVNLSCSVLTLMVLSERDGYGKKGLDLVNFITVCLVHQF